MTAQAVKGFDGKYEVAFDGRVFNTKSGKELRGYPDKNGYIKITLTVNRKKQLTQRRSRLVALAWIPNPNNLPFVNHKNGIKTDDSVRNLEWVSAQENTRHAWDNGLCKPYDRTKPYNRQGIIDANKRRRSADYEI